MTRETDWFLTRMFMQHMVRIDGECWYVAEVARSGEFLAWRLSDEAGRWTYWNYPEGGGDVVGCNYYRWFPGEALIEEIRERWER